MILSQQDFSSRTYSSIVSVVPSLTELLYDLGLDKEVKGITKFCVHPREWYAEKPRIGGTKTLDIEKIKTLHPDLIIANKEENTKEQIEELALSLDVLVTDVDSLSSALQMIKNIGCLTGKKHEAYRIVENIEQKFFLLQKKVSCYPKLNAAYFIWKKPYMIAGGDTFINDMMSSCNFENIFANEARYPEVTNEMLQHKKNICQLVLLSSEPYPFCEKHIPEFQSIFLHAKVILADGEMFSWYGSRLLAAVDYFENFLMNIHLSK